MIKIICVAYERPIAMRGLIDSFILQTNPAWELNIIHDGPAPKNIMDTIALYNDERVKFKCSATRTQNYGHVNRKMMLDSMRKSEDFLLMTNDDNYYTPVFVEYMLRECKPDVGFVYCDSVHSHFHYNHHNTKIQEHWIDIGSFIVKLNVAKQTGFNNVTWSADGVYAEECLANCKKLGLRDVYIPKPIFIHN